MSKKPLTAKKTLGAKTKLKANPRPKKQSTPKWTTLRRKADKEFAHYIRIRDSWYEDGAWVGLCITCERKCLVIDANGKWQKSNGWGHFITRGFFALRYDEENVNLQCSHCNAWMDKETMLSFYKKALVGKYGDDTDKKLVKQAKQPDKRPTIAELEQIIHDAKESLLFYLKQSV